MLRRSLSNFMNAFTSADHTSYPFATTNEQDFYNLMSVYLDATLRPLLRENDFAQEGWRIGPENPSADLSGSLANNENQQLVFKGVVYNEMKGQMSDAGYLYYILFQKQLMPSINNSGGDPQRITDLTHEQLKSFHRIHYHPSNAKIFTYGNMPLQRHLKEIARRLRPFDRIDRDQDIKRPISLEDGPQYVTVAGPTDPLVDTALQNKTSTSWLMGDTSNTLETFSLGIVTSLLLDGYGSPLYRNLIEAGLGVDWSPNTGFDTSGKIGVFSIGLTGVKQADIPKVKDTITSTLREVHKNGFDKSKVDGLLHQLDLALRHKTAQFGMNLMQRLQPAWFNGVDPFNGLAWNDTVSKFKTRFAQGGYLKSLLDEYLLNDKTLTFTMTPSSTYSSDLAVEESSRLKVKISEVEAQAGGAAQARKELEEREAELLAIQENARSESLDCLPTLHVGNIPRHKKRKELRDAIVGDIKVQWRAAFTSGLTYFRAVNQLPGLSHELRMYIPLFTDSIMRLGTRDRSMEQLEDLIKLKTGGITTGYHSSTSPRKVQKGSEGLVFSGYALDDNVPYMYELLRIIIQETNFDGPEAESKIRELLQSAASSALDSIAQSGHAYAGRFAKASLSPQGRFSEETGGLTQVQMTAGLASRASTDGLGDVIEKLKMIQKVAMTAGNTMRAAITCGPESVSANEAQLQKFLQSLPSATSLPNNDSLPTYHLPNKVIFRLPYQVYYTGLALPTVPYMNAAAASLEILAQLVTHKYLHHEIREKGGAYGGGAYASGLSGTFGFYSYRDPNPQNTIKIMNSAGVWARDNAWSDRDLEEAKLSVFQTVDAPESVSEEGMARFLAGVDDKRLQQHREQLLDVTARDVQEAAQKYLVEGMKNSRLAVLGEEKDWFKKEEGWTVSDLSVVQSEHEKQSQEDDVV